MTEEKSLDLDKLQSELKAAQEKLAQTEKQVADNLAGWQRAQADYANFKKETEKRSAELVEFANAAFMSEVLPVYSHFKLALNHIPEEQKKQDWVIGVYNIQKQFQEFFKKYNITEIKTIGEKFDPRIHEAVTHEAKAGFAADVVFDEVQPGYLLGERVITPAKVRVAKWAPVS